MPNITVSFAMCGVFVDTNVLVRAPDATRSENANCETLLTGNLNPGQVVRGVTVGSPFARR